MPCNMAARGESLALMEADGERSLRELLEDALARVAEGPGKISGLIDVAGEACEVNLLVDSGGLVAACLDCTQRGTLRGPQAVEALRGLLGEAPASGYLEPMKLDRDALELDLELEPQARLPQPVPPEKLLASGEEAQAPQTPPGGKQEAPPAEQAGREAPSERREAGEEEEAREEGPLPIARDKLEEPGTIDAAELAAMLVYLLGKSRVVMHAHGVKRLLHEAREASSRDREAFYRAVVEVRNDGIYNAFYYGGRLCSVVYLDPTVSQARFLRDINEEALVERIREDAKEKGVELMLLYRVDCPDCAKVFLADCFTEQEKREAREGKRGGLLARLFGRRR